VEELIQVYRGSWDLATQSILLGATVSIFWELLDLTQAQPSF
jgi:hypothetical protein